MNVQIEIFAGYKFEESESVWRSGSTSEMEKRYSLLRFECHLILILNLNLICLVFVYDSFTLEGKMTLLTANWNIQEHVYWLEQ